MTTTARLVADTERYLFAGSREEQNRLNGPHDDTTTTFAFEFALRGIKSGAVLNVDLELVYVWSVNDSGLSAQVERGWWGSTPAAHDAAAIVTINPKFSKFDILDALNDDLNDLCAPSNGLFAPRTVELDYQASVRGYDLTGVDGLLGILGITYEEVGPEKQWPRIKNWELRREANTTDFPSGLALVLNQGAQPGHPIRVTYAAPFAPLTTMADVVEDVAGISTFAQDIPPLGAAFRLTQVRELKRNFTERQGEPRRADEVGAGAQLRSALGYAQLRQQRIHNEKSRLHREWPTRRMGT